MAASLARAKEFTSEVVDELKKVTWPDQAQLKNFTFVIIVFIAIVSLIIWGMDVVTRLVVNDLIINLFAG